MKNKYFKTTQGENIQLFLAAAIAYTSQGTIALFQANATDGEIGLFDDTDTLISGALSDGDPFYIAQKVDGQIKRTQPLTYSGSEVREVAYVAPVKQVTNVGYNGTTGSLNVGTLLANMIFPLSIVETTPASQPFPVWPYEDIVKTSDTIQSILARMCKTINDPRTAMNLPGGTVVTAEMLTDGTFTVNTVGSGNVGVTKGSTTVTATGHNVVAGTYVRIGGTADTSPVYKVASVTTNAFELDSPYQGATNAALSIANLGTMTVITDGGFKLTAVNYGEHFRIALQESLANADVFYTTPFKNGIGDGASVVELEKEAQVFSGYTTLNAAFTEDFGKPTSFASASGTYAFTYIDYIKNEASVAAPHVTDVGRGHIVIAYPNGGTTPKTEIQSYL